MAGRGEVIDDGSDMYFDIIPQIDFKYDAEGKKMWVEGDDAIFISSLTTRLYYWTYSLSPEIQYQTAEQTNAAPQAPTLEFYEEWWEYGYLTMAWSIPTVNVNGYTLPTSQMYYNLYFDGEVYEFSPDVHWFFTEEISDIPYNFTDQYDILLDGMIHEFYIYDQGIEDIGMESVYVAEDGTEYRSERTTAHIENGVVSVRDISLNPVVSVSYHNISGVKINNPKNGLYIKTTVYADGSRESKKVMIR